MSIGRPLSSVRSAAELQPGKLYLVLLHEECTAHDAEGVRQVLAEMDVEAVIFAGKVLTDMRQLSALDLADLKTALNDFKPGEPALKVAGLTPERVVAALQRHPDLLEGVRALLTE